MAKQLNLAVVFNGGVSLAVWMGGVTHELNAVRLASEDIRKSGAEGRVIDAWEAILGQRKVVIDLVAGTSAGGLNGSLLATAIARGADLPPMRDVWADVASLDAGKLTRSYEKQSSGEHEDPKSVLDGFWFATEIARIFGDIGGSQSGVPVSERDCRLLVTATALNANPTQLLLENGDAMNTVDSRRVYRFKRETTVDFEQEFCIAQPAGSISVINDFKAQSAALSQAARASASFPVAFEPVPETPELIGQRVEAYSPADPAWLADGGLLDNAPFEPLLSALPRRPLDKPATRMVLYVTPAIDRTLPPSSFDPQVSPPLRKVLKWVTSSMQQPDARLDRDALARAFSLMSFASSQPYGILTDYLQSPSAFMAGDFAPLSTSAATLLERYRVNRAYAVKSWAMSTPGTGAPPLAPPPEDRYQSLAQIIATMPANLARLLPSGDAIGSAPIQQWNWGLSTADRLLQWWGLVLNDLPGSGENPELALAMIHASQAQQWVRGLRDELYEQVHGSSAWALSTRLDTMNEFYFSGPTPRAVRVYDELFAVLTSVSAAVQGATVSDLIQISLCIEVISGAFSWQDSDALNPVFHYARLTPGEAPPNDIVPDVSLDAEGAPVPWTSRKLYGERWGHFGAFASPEGRRHDWLWGRIDGAWQLSGLLLGGGDSAHEMELRQTLIDAILTAEGVPSRESFRASARQVCELTDLKMAKELLDSRSGMQTVKNLILTLLLLKRPSGGFMRAGWVALAPIYPRRHVERWPAWQRGLAQVSWVMSYPLRRVALWGTRRSIAKSLRKSERS